MLAEDQALVAIFVVGYDENCSSADNNTLGLEDRGYALFLVNAVRTPAVEWVVGSTGLGADAEY